MRSCYACLVSALLLASGCASLNEKECRDGDWGAIGLRDGQQGLPLSRLDDHRKACLKYGIDPNNRTWLAARERGVRHYCTPLNGLKVGRYGAGYAGVCPAEMEAPFLRAYFLGREVSSAQARVSQLENDLYALRNRIANTAPGKERDRLIREQSYLDASWFGGGQLGRARDELWRAERRADDLLLELSSACQPVVVSATSCFVGK